MTKTPRASKSRVPVTGSVLGAIEGAFSELEELKQECSDWKDNLEERFSGTAKYETLDSTVSALEFVDNGIPDLPGESGDFSISWIEDQSKKLSRSKRRDNATAMLSAAIDGLREWAEKVREEADEDDDDSETEATEAEEAADELEGYKDEADSAEFPGMYG